MKVSDATTWPPPHADWNRGDCGPLRDRRLARQNCRLTLIGIAATAAAPAARTPRSLNPPHADWNRGDCGRMPSRA